MPTDEPLARGESDADEPLARGESDADEPLARGESDDGPSPRLLIGITIFGAAAALAVLIGALAVIQSRDEARPLAVADVPAPQANSPSCVSLSRSYPGDFTGGWQRVQILAPAPPGAAAWRRGHDSVVARCGVPRPAEFVVGTSVEQVNGVQWFRVSDPAIAVGTWYAVDRGVYVAVTMPDGSGSEPLTEMSDIVGTALPSVKPDPGALPG